MTPETLLGSGQATQLFGAKVADYLASRPDYPAALFERLRQRLPPPASVADVGAGTGLLTAGLLAAGYTVTAVEPDAAMRAAADARLAAHPAYRSAAGSAETMPMPAQSLDLITAAQAFHWFDIPRARAECRRLLRPSGQVLLVWNHRAACALNAELDGFIKRHGGALGQAMARGDDLDGVPAFFGAAGFERWQLPHQQQLDAEGLAALLFSRSYMPARDSAAGREALSELGQIAVRHAGAEGRVTLPYDTVACWGACPG